MSKKEMEKELEKDQKQETKLSKEEKKTAIKELKEARAEEFKSRTKKQHIMVALFYLAIFAIMLTYDELLLRFVFSKKIEVRNLTFLVFIPAEAAFFATIAGFGKKGTAARIIFPIESFIISAYYIGQVLFYHNSQSIFSLALLGMGGAAIGNFGWALPNAFRKSLVFMILMLIPFILSVVFSVKKKPDKIKGYSLLVHLFAFISVIVLWVGGIGALRLGGTGRTSVYRLFFNTLADTDTTYGRLGALTTNVVELGAKFFGIGGNSAEDIVEIDKNALSLDDPSTTSENKTGKNSVSEDTAVEVVREPWVNEDIDFDKVLASVESDDEKKLIEYYSTKEPTCTNEMTGYFEGYNLIYICGESFWTYACNEEVTPTLYKMAHNGIVLNNYYNSFKNTTTNGEYAFNTSMWPDVSRIANNGTDVGSFAQSASKFMPQGLGDLTLQDKNTTTLAFHNYYGKYYRRILSWPNLGYQCKFMGSGMTFTTTWPSSDLEMMQQSIPDYINSDEPFYAYYMTFSGHGPYTSTNNIYRKNIDYVKNTLGPNTDITEETAVGYLACNTELDKAMEYLLDELEKAGKLDNTVIVIAGDHYPYYLSTEGRDQLAGYTMDENFDIYKSTCIIYNAGMSEPMEVDTYCSNVDILPTILNLFNIEHDSRLMAGTDIFDNRDGVVHRAALYNMSFITDKCKYNGSTGEATWTEEAQRQYTPDKRDAYVEAMVSDLTNDYVAATQSIELNVFKDIWYYSGMLTEEELLAEEERENNVLTQDEEFNAQDAEEKLRKEQEKAAKQAAEEAAAAAAAAAQNAENQMADPNNQTTDPQNPPADVITD